MCAHLSRNRARRIVVIHIQLAYRVSRRITKMPRLQAVKLKRNFPSRCGSHPKGGLQHIWLGSPSIGLCPIKVLDVYLFTMVV
jgi:hypothetical protein